MKKNTRKGGRPQFQSAKVVVETRRPQVRRQRKPRQVQRAPKPTARKQTISRASLQWALAIADPWNASAFKCHIPYGGLSSRKVRGILRLTTSIGTGGFGYVFMTPCVTNNAPSIIYTGSTFTRTDAAVLSANNTYYTGAGEAFCTTLPFTAGNLIDGFGGPRIGARIACAGLRIRYVGTTLNQSGLIYALRETNHDSTIQYELSGVASTATWGAKAHCHITPNDRNWHYIVDFPANREELDINDRDDVKGSDTQVSWPYSRGINTFYDPVSNNRYTISKNGGNVGVPTAGFLFTGVAGQLMEIEYIVHVEYYGEGVDFDLTPSHADPQGAHRVMAAANHTALTRQKLHPKTGWPLLQSELSKELSAAENVLLPKAVDAVERAVAGLASAA